MRPVTATMLVKGFTTAGDPFTAEVPLAPVTAGTRILISGAVHQVVAVDAEGVVHVGRGYYEQGRRMTGIRRVTWDGKDFAAIQTATAAVPRVHGRPCAEVDEDWRLSVAGVPLVPGDSIEVSESGEITFWYGEGTGDDPPPG
jgi:hypothetical protein